MVIKKDAATEIHAQALRAITELSKILYLIEGKCSEEDYARIKKVVGVSIGEIQVDILDPINLIYPELDDLS